MADPKWYIVHAYSNFEKKVAEAIRQSASEKGMGDLFEEVFVPTEEVTEVRRGRKINTERRYLPGYVLVKMVLNDQTYHLIKDTPKVTGFLGSGNKPMPVSQKEVDRIRGVVTDAIERPRSTITFEIGENVRVVDGPFASFSGVVEDVDEDQQRVKVAVSIFGRATPVELEFTQVEKGS
ncbi:MAG: transcription termination/antitermination protein NusG [Parvularculaceae bacterium]